MVKKTLSIVIPAYNEAGTIKEVLEIVKSLRLDVDKEIIVVDDGSTDRTREIVSEIKDVRLIKHDKNMGKGFAVRTGIKESTGEIILIQDADMEYDPTEYPQLIAPILAGEAKVVYGSRFISKEQKSKNKLFVRKHDRAYFMAYIGGRILTILANLLYNAKITDEPTCYKVFEAKVLKSVNLKCKRFEFCPEVTAKIKKKGYKIKEVPISYKPRTFEEGKKINWRDGVEAIWTLIKYRFVN
jgi:dolichol-phosphate mannosyltransferase